jgi:methylated-DNA-protein-cysteine methyltransferase-like protein
VEEQIMISRMRPKPTKKTGRAGRRQVPEVKITRRFEHDRGKSKPNPFDAFYEVVRQVPKGRVSTYGAIATLAGKPRAARQVGFALGALRDPNTTIPWQRVLASKSTHHGTITPRGRAFAARQRKLLESEGVRFDARGRVDLRTFGWPPRPVAAKRDAPPPAASKRGNRTGRNPDSRNGSEGGARGVRQAKVTRQLRQQ